MDEQSKPKSPEPMPAPKPASAPKPTPKPIRELPPLETGGIEARQGIGIQDHVAAGFCIQMVADATLKEVWCERHDDITLVWEGNGIETIEFVQVKSNELDQLWTTAKLCARDNAKPPAKDSKEKPQAKIGTSILEKSLANDRAAESCRFRMVTSRPVDSVLKILTFSPDSERRTASKESFETLVNELRIKVNGFVSANGNDCGFWAERTTWQEIHGLTELMNRNLLMLSRALNNLGQYAAPDQLEEIYKAIVSKNWDAALHDWWEKDKKKILKEPFIQWLNQKLVEMLHPKSSPGKIRRKMKAAHLPDDAISAAGEQRDFYRRETLAPKYVDVSHRRLIEQEVAAHLQRLRAKLDAGDIPDSGAHFHAICLEDLKGLQDKLQDTAKPTLAFLYGCMYSITDRCQHRFRKFTL